MQCCSTDNTPDLFKYSEFQECDIVNISLVTENSETWGARFDSGVLTKLISQMLSVAKLVVHAASNESFRGILEDPGLESVVRHLKLSSYFINAVALLDDGLHLSSYTNQPGKSDALSRRAVSAVGTNVTVLKWNKPRKTAVTTVSSGTSLAAPIVSGAAAIVLGALRAEFPGKEIHMDFVASAILDSATPIILVPKTEGQRKEYGYCLELETLVALEGVMAKDIDSITSYKPKSGVFKDEIIITEKMRRTSLKRYGRGRLQVVNAMKLAKERFHLETIE